MLLWGLQMVREGMMRAFGVSLRNFLTYSTSSRVKSFFSGVVFTMVLQSSTATTLIVSSFLAGGLITLPAAIAVILGADTGTTIVAQILTFDTTWVSSILLLLGYVFYQLRNKKSQFKHIGHVLIGLGLMLMALMLVKISSAPLRESELFPLLMGPLENDFFMPILIAGAITWVFHSSLAMVLLIASLPLPLGLGLTMVLGANIGGVLPALFATLKDKENSFRLPLANLLVRITGVIAASFALPFMLPFFESLLWSHSQLIISFHMAFNIILGLAFLPFCKQIASVVERFGKERPAEKRSGEPLYLDSNDLEVPTIALSNASREVLRMADKLEDLLFNVYQLFRTNNSTILGRVREMDDVIDDLYKSIKSYLAKIGAKDLDEKDAERHMLIMSYATSLEHSGDIVDRSIIHMAKKKMEKHKVFSDEGFKEIRTFFESTLDSLKLSRNVFMTEDPDLARRLFVVKGDFKRDERESSARHMRRLADGVPETLSTSSMHTDIIRDLVRIQSLITSVSYPILERSGQLRKTRLLADWNKEHNETAEKL
tara:strand:+ start:291164 stop:292795 length:1632 start_codon:yes stop_codon:yes gene_type:complete